MEPVQPGSGTNGTPDQAGTLIYLADRASKRIATALMVAGAVIGLAVYWKPAPTRFEAFVAGGEMFRINSKTGTVIACNEVRCMTVVRRGQRLMGYREGRLFQARPATPAPAEPQRRLMRETT